MDNPPENLPPVAELVKQCSKELGWTPGPGRTPPLLIELFWKHSTKKRPLPTETDCNSFSAIVDIYADVPMPNNKQTPPVPIRTALSVVLDAMDCEDKRLREQKTVGVKNVNADITLEQFAAVRRAIGHRDLFCSLLGEDHVHVRYKGSESIVLGLRAEAEGLWEACGHTVPSPHFGSAVVRFLALVCDYLGHPTTPAAVAGFLRKPAAWP